MKITFKNVGQGDSIIIDLNRDDGYNFGIIDCKKEMDYHLYATNYMDRSSDFIRPITEDILSERLSAHDELIEQYHIEADHTFTFTEGRIQEVI